jgi:hypothetical protein
MNDPKTYLDQRLEVQELQYSKRFDSISTHVSNIEKMLESYISGFPNDDPAGHREYHESVIEKNKAYTDLCRKMIFELSKWGLISLAIWFFFGGGFHHFIETMKVATK